MRSSLDSAASNSQPGPAAFSPLIAPQGLWPIDKLFIAYIAATGLLVAVAAFRHPSALLALCGHAVAIGFILALGRYSSGHPSRAALWIRHWYVLIYLPFCYKEVPYIVSSLHLPIQDITLARWDVALWRTDPVFLLDVLQNPVLTEFLELVYFLFIPSVIVLGLLYWYQRSSAEFRYCTFLVVATFLITYLGYVAVPARGPHFMGYVSQHPALQGLWFFHFFQATIDKLEGIQYDCFPSGHVAVTIVCAYSARKLASPLLWTYCVFAALIAFSTIYLRYHYTIDVLAGGLLAALLIVICPRIYRALGRGTNP
jgi:membrane-associated phospholipid phosphatase